MDPAVVGEQASTVRVQLAAGTLTLGCAVQLPPLAEGADTSSGPLWYVQVPDAHADAEPTLVHVFCPSEVTWTEQATLVGGPHAQPQVAAFACSPS